MSIKFYLETVVKRTIGEKRHITEKWLVKSLEMLAGIDFQGCLVKPALLTFFVDGI
jgi:hypothetical protein